MRPPLRKNPLRMATLPMRLAVVRPGLDDVHGVAAHHESRLLKIYQLFEAINPIFYFKNLIQVLGINGFSSVFKCAISASRPSTHAPCTAALSGQQGWIALSVRKRPPRLESRSRWTIVLHARIPVGCQRIERRAACDLLEGSSTLTSR
jgi:hypothetical protein